MAKSYLDAPVPAGPLLPFEERQLTLLLNQYDAMSERIKDAFILEITHRAARETFIPSVVRIHG